MGLAQLQESEFNEAVKKQQEENARKERQRNDGGGGTRDYENVVYSALEVEKLKFVRIVGYPFHARHKDPLYSPKEVFISWLTGDKGNRFRVVWPSKDDDPNWFLYSLYYRIMERTWDSQGDASYIHESLNPEIFKRVSENIVKPGDKPKSKYESGWWPTKYIVMNVIDREIYDWHQENKHTVLLSKKARPYTRADGSEIMLYEPGVTGSVWNQIMGNDIAGTYGDFLNYDVVIRRLDTKQQPFYRVYHPDEENKLLATCDGEMEKFKQRYPFYNHDNHVAPLSNEESEWERYNVEKIFKVTSYQKILRNLSIFLKKVDATFSSNYLEQLQDLAEDERKQYQDDEEVPEFPPKEVSNKKVEEVSNKKVEEPNEVPLPTSTRTTRKRAPAVEKKDIMWASIRDDFKGAEYLTDEEKNAVFNIDLETGTITYDPQYDNELLDCPECKTPGPNFFKTCPRCGVGFE